MGAVMMLKKPDILLAAVFLVLAFYNPLASLAAQYNSDAFGGSLVVYGVFRAIDRFVSFVSDVDIQGGLVLASVAASPGKLLQPAVQARERFIDILFPLMLLSGILSTVMVPVAKIGAVVGLIGISLKTARKYFFRDHSGLVSLDRLSNALIKIAVLVALILPVSYSAGYMVGNWMTSSAWDHAYGKFAGFEAETGLEQATSVPAAVEPDTSIQDTDPNEEEGSILGNVTGWVQEKASNVVDGSQAAIGNASMEAMEMLAKASTVAGAIGDVVDASTKLLVAYIIKTLLLPILTGWGLLWVIRQMFPREIVYVKDLDGQSKRLSESGKMA